MKPAAASPIPPRPPARWSACASSTCRRWWPARSPRRCWPISAPTSSRSNCRARAIRCANWRRTRTACRCGGRSPTATRRASSLDLRKPDGMALLARLLADRDVLIENFRSGTLDQWGITREWLQEINPRLTILRVTGFGQTGPYRDRPGLCANLRGDERLHPHVRRGRRLAAASRLSDLGRDRRTVRRGRRAVGAVPAEGRSGGARSGDRLLDDGSDAAHARLPRHRIRPARRGANRQRQSQPVCRAGQYLRDRRRQMGLDRGLDAEHLRAAMRGARTPGAAERSADSPTIRRG